MPNAHEALTEQSLLMTNAPARAQDCALPQIAALVQPYMLTIWMGRRSMRNPDTGKRGYGASGRSAAEIQGVRFLW
jgi:hypothetical protein